MTCEGGNREDGVRRLGKRELLEKEVLIWASSKRVIKTGLEVR